MLLTNSIPLRPSMLKPIHKTVLFLFVVIVINIGFNLIVSQNALNYEHLKSCKEFYTKISYFSSEKIPVLFFNDGMYIFVEDNEDDVREFLNVFLLVGIFFTVFFYWILFYERIALGCLITGVYINFKSIFLRSIFLRI